MADVFTQQKRSAVMARIRGRGNKETEIALMKILRRNRITGWRRHQQVFGRPDFIFQKEKVAVFVDGCFWHGCPVHYKQPANNAAFWGRKYSTNRARDQHVNKALRKKGWQVIRIWEHELTKAGDKCVARILAAIDKNTDHPRLRRRESG